MPTKDASYHKAAIRYNEELAVFADKLSKTLENDEIKRWCRSVSRQHKIHAGHHRKALKRLKHGFRSRRNQENRMDDAPKTIEQEQADFAAQMEAQENPAPDDTPTETPPPVDPAPSAPPVENTPDPEQDAEPIPAGVGTALPSDGGVTA